MRPHSGEIYIEFNSVEYLVEYVIYPASPATIHSPSEEVHVEIVEVTNVAGRREPDVLVAMENSVYFMDTLREEIEEDLSCES